MATYPYPYAFSMSPSVDPDSPWAHCPPLAEVAGEQIIEVYMYWAIGREYLRAHDPSRMAAWDKRCADGINAGDLSFLTSTGDAALDTFLEQSEEFFSVTRAGLHPGSCTIDWREVACAAFWFASMDAAQRDLWIETIKAGNPYVAECAPTKAAGGYGDAPMSVSTVPIIPGQKAKDGMPTWQKVALGVGAVALVAVAGIATTGGYKKNPLTERQLRALAEGRKKQATAQRARKKNKYYDYKWVVDTDVGTVNVGDVIDREDRSPLVVASIGRYREYVIFKNSAGEKVSYEAGGVVPLLKKSRQ